mmetsp:Transcript_14392/g.30199  ORF Transcript_14392/g.30199 Transcript_14392/m.30199 type:complete len:236 (+) Transcript_14392:740-1447(+)
MADDCGTGMIPQGLRTSEALYAAEDATTNDALVAFSSLPSSKREPRIGPPLRGCTWRSILSQLVSWAASCSVFRTRRRAPSVGPSTLVCNKRTPDRGPKPPCMLEDAGLNPGFPHCGFHICGLLVCGFHICELPICGFHICGIPVCGFHPCGFPVCGFQACGLPVCGFQVLASCDAKIDPLLMGMAPGIKDEAGPHCEPTRMDEGEPCGDTVWNACPSATGMPPDEEPCCHPEPS